MLCGIRKFRPVGEELETVLAAIGPRLRSLRRGAGATLLEVSEQTGISVSTLSRVESGARAPTLDLLMPLAQAYRVALDELIDAPPTRDPRLYPQPITRHGMTAIPLSHNPGGLQAFKNVLAAGPVGLEPEPRSHEGYHWLCVLTGRLRVVLGARDLVLGAGEAVEFDTRVPHWFGNAEPRVVEFLSVLGSSRSGIHVRTQLTGPDRTRCTAQGRWSSG